MCECALLLNHERSTLQGMSPRNAHAWDKNLTYLCTETRKIGCTPSSSPSVRGAAGFLLALSPTKLSSALEECARFRGSSSPSRCWCVSAAAPSPLMVNWWCVVGVAGVLAKWPGREASKRGLEGH